MTTDAALVLVSNRGPATFEDGEARRGGGGLVTALTGLVHHRDALWIALTDMAMRVSNRKFKKWPRRRLLQHSSWRRLLAAGATTILPPPANG